MVIDTGILIASIALLLLIGYLCGKRDGIFKERERTLKVITMFEDKVNDSNE